MPRIKLSLWKYPKNLNPGVQLDRCHIYFQDDHFAERLSMWEAIKRFLDDWPKEVEALGEVKLAFCLNDFCEIALNPSMLTEPGKKTPLRFLEYNALFPDFALALLAEVRTAKQNPTATHKAIAALRTNQTVTDRFGNQIPMAEADDKTIANAISTSRDVVKKARHQLAKLDAHMWPTAKGKKKP